jgi:hypothetical protein
MTLDEIIERISLDLAQHMTGEPAEPVELQRLEELLSTELPEPYRAFLTRLGPGIYYQKHEIFGGRRVMIHDIELVPDLMSIQRQLVREAAAPPPGWFPLHRGGGALHLIDLSSGAERGRIVRSGHGESYPDLPAFLEAIVLP